ncbi:DnaJ family C protein [Ceratobasidium sp. AG-Ba]|nr:DnaJ family C protein [Ceratobasidium sp. AG-Ba]QRW10772.1 DnaJ family C protein [Ceratobasidium sp. AG-Ba]
MDDDPDRVNLNHRNARRDDDDDENVESLQDSQSDESLYALFNLSKTATTEEIQKRYKTLAVSLHPDKVRDESRKAAAVARFQRFQRAYDILTDPNKRAIYDMFGEEGLKTKWDIGPKYKTPEELRDEYARLARAARLQDAENLVRSQGEVICAVNALSVSERRLSWPDRLYRVSQGQLGLKHKFDTVINDRTRFTFTSRLISMRGKSGGNVFGTIKHQYSPRLQLEATSGLLEPRTLVSKATFELNEETTLRAESTVIAANALADLPRLTLTAQRLLDPTLTGVIAFTTPTLTTPSALAVSLSSTNGLQSTLELSPARLQLSAEYGVRIGGKHGVLVSASAGGGLTEGGVGMMLEVNGTAKIAEATTLRLGVGAGMPGGISFRINLNRLGQRMIIPIQLSREFDLSLALYTAVIPSIGALLVNEYVIKPRRQKMAQTRLAKLREARAEQLAEDRQAAVDYVASLGDQVEKKIEAERAVDGLIILEARYGSSKQIEYTHSESTMDVAVPLQLLVNGSQLSIPGGRSKAGLLGFYDPCPGERKSLRVKYSFRGRVHQVTAEDKAPVEMPLRGHAMV